MHYYYVNSYAYFICIKNNISLHCITKVSMKTKKNQPGGCHQYSMFTIKNIFYFFYKFKQKMEQFYTRFKKSYSSRKALERSVYSHKNAIQSTKYNDQSLSPESGLIAKKHSENVQQTASKITIPALKLPKLIPPVIRVNNQSLISFGNTRYCN